MLNAYTTREMDTVLTDQAEIEANIASVIWIDLNSPTHEEELFVEKLLAAPIPTREEMREIELSNRLYIEEGRLYATASIITKADTLEPRIHAITFVIVGNRLITVRYSDPKPFKYFTRSFYKSEVVYQNGTNVMAALQQAIVNRMADVLENTGHHIDDLSQVLFKPPVKDPKTKIVKNTNFEEVLRTIGLQGDLISKTRESLVSVARLLNFISQSSHFKNENATEIDLQMLIRDIQALNDHASYLGNKVGFLLDATLGMISMQQNNIIKIFSVAAVIFLPPTLVASIYGMNFKFIPEMDWHFGYPFAICIMLVSAYIPYKFFKRKGWL